MSLPQWTSAAIIAERPSKNVVDPHTPYAFLLEPECQNSGEVEDVAVVFLTNRECPYKCLMCDLWKNTTDVTVPYGAIPDQIDYALSRLPPARHIKLYNSGNFFDPQAIPPEDHDAIITRVKEFKTVIVENHPRLCGPSVQRFVKRLRQLESDAKFEVAMGLETVHPEVLRLLNKQMTTDHFRDACRYLTSIDVAMRAFVLLRPPTLSEAEGVDWAKRSIDFAFENGVAAVSVIPTRGGNGAMEKLAADSLFHPPSLASLEAVMQWGLKQRRGRVFVDLWDVGAWCGKDVNVTARVQRLQAMNLQQQVIPLI